MEMTTPVTTTSSGVVISMTSFSSFAPKMYAARALNASPPRGQVVHGVRLVHLRHGGGGDRAGFVLTNFVPLSSGKDGVGRSHESLRSFQEHVLRLRGDPLGAFLDARNAAQRIAGTNVLLQF